MTNNVIGRRSGTTGIIELKTDLDKRQLRDEPLLHASSWHARRAASTDNGDVTHMHHDEKLANFHPPSGFETRHQPSSDVE